MATTAPATPSPAPATPPAETGAPKVEGESLKPKHSGDSPVIRKFNETRGAKPTKAFDAPKIDVGDDDADPDSESALDRRERADPSKKAPVQAAPAGERARDPQTGQFLPVDDAAPKQPAQVAAPVAQPGKLKFGGKEYDSLEAAEQDWKVTTGRLSASDKRFNDTNKRLTDAVSIINQQRELLVKAGVIDENGFVMDPKQGAQAKPAAPQGGPAPTAPADPDFFSKSAVEDEPTWNRLYEILGDQNIPDPTQRLVKAMAYLTWQNEQRLKSYHDYLSNQVLSQQLGPMQQFLQGVQAVNETAEFIRTHIEALHPETGEPLYADLPRTRETVAALVQVIDQLDPQIARTPFGFDYAYRVVKEWISGRAGQSAPSPAPAASNADLLAANLQARLVRDSAGAGAVVPGASGAPNPADRLGVAPDSEAAFKQRISRAGGRSGVFHL